MRVYVASSWRNPHQPSVVADLRKAGHEVYDFRNPPHSTGFNWSDMDPNWADWTAAEFRHELLSSSIAAQGFMSDFRAMRWADAIVMVLPCGKSSHMELGYGTGAGKRTIILLERNGPVEPDLMYLQADSICLDIAGVLQVLGPASRAQDVA